MGHPCGPPAINTQRHLSDAMRARGAAAAGSAAGFSAGFTAGRAAGFAAGFTADRRAGGGGSAEVADEDLPSDDAQDAGKERNSGICAHPIGQDNCIKFDPTTRSIVARLHAEPGGDSVHHPLAAAAAAAGAAAAPAPAPTAPAAAAPRRRRRRPRAARTPPPSLNASLPAQGAKGVWEKDFYFQPLREYDPNKLWIQDTFVESKTFDSIQETNPDGRARRPLVEPGEQLVQGEATATAARAARVRDVHKRPACARPLHPAPAPPAPQRAAPPHKRRASPRAAPRRTDARRPAPLRARELPTPPAPQRACVPSRQAKGCEGESWSPLPYPGPPAWCKGNHTTPVPRPCTPDKCQRHARAGGFPLSNVTLPLFCTLQAHISGRLPDPKVRERLAAGCAAAFRGRPLRCCRWVLWKVLPKYFFHRRFRIKAVCHHSLPHHHPPSHHVSPPPDLRSRRASSHATPFPLAKEAPVAIRCSSFHPVFCKSLPRALKKCAPPAP
eukprot:gene6189-biopygen23842